MAIKIPQKVIDQIKDEIMLRLEKSKVRIDQSDIDDILDQVRSNIETPTLDSKEVVRGLLDHVVSTEEEKRLDFYRTEVFTPEIKSEIGKQVLDQIEVPKDGVHGEKGEKGEPGKTPQLIPLTERDKKEIADLVDVTKLVKDRKQDIVKLVEQLKTGKIKLPSHAGIDIKEIIAEINKAGANFNYINYSENVDKTSIPQEAGVVDWNDEELALNVQTGIGPVLQIGQEVYILIYNDTGAPILNGKVLRPKAAFPVGDLVVPTVEKAKADVFSTVEGTIMVSTMVIPDGEVGLATRFGRVRGIDTNGLQPGAGIYVSETTAGEFTTTQPNFPNYPISIGGVLIADENDGEIIISVTRDIFDTINNFWNGTFRETIDFTVSSAGGVVTGSLVPDNGHDDMTMMFSDGFTMLTTTPAATIELTPGTADIPQQNFVYVPKSTKVLTVSTSGWPTDEHIKVANVTLRTAALTESDGALVNRNWNDHIENTTTFQGHLSHMTEKLRQFEAQWDSGLEGSATLSGTPTDVWIANTAGVVYQLHKQNFPALDMETGDDIHIVNNQANPYVTVTNLNGQVLDANGQALSNRSFSFVIWGVQNKSGETSHLMCNLPSNSYAKNAPANAVADALNYSVYSIPKPFQGTGFLIARFTFVLEADGTTWSLYDTEDLRGKLPNATAGGGAGGTGVTTWPGLTDTPSAFVANGIPRVNSGGTALDFTSLLKSGATQVAAGAAAGEFWKTSGHATLPDNVVLQGV